MAGTNFDNTVIPLSSQQAVDIEKQTKLRLNTPSRIINGLTLKHGYGIAYPVDKQKLDSAFSRDDTSEQFVKAVASLPSSTQVETIGINEERGVVFFKQDENNAMDNLKIPEPNTEGCLKFVVLDTDVNISFPASGESYKCLAGAVLVENPNDSDGLTVCTQEQFLEQYAVAVPFGSRKPDVILREDFYEAEKSAKNKMSDVSSGLSHENDGFFGYNAVSDADRFLYNEADPDEATDSTYGFFEGTILRITEPFALENLLREQIATAKNNERYQDKELIAWFEGFYDFMKEKHFQRNIRPDPNENPISPS